MSDERTASKASGLHVVYAARALFAPSRSHTCIEAALVGETCQVWNARVPGCADAYSREGGWYAGKSSAEVGARSVIEQVPGGQSIMRDNAVLRCFMRLPCWIAAGSLMCGQMKPF